MSPDEILEQLNEHQNNVGYTNMQDIKRPTTAFIRESSIQEEPTATVDQASNQCMIMQNAPIDLDELEKEIVGGTSTMQPATPGAPMDYRRRSTRKR